MDVAGDLAPLLLLAGHHPLQQLAALLVELAQAAQGPVVLGDVAQHHQPADRQACRSGMATTVGSKRRVAPSLVTISSSASPLGDVGGRGPPRPPRAAARPAGDRSPRPGEAEEPLGRRVGVDHPAQRVEHHHRLGDGLEDQPAGHRADAEQPEPEQPQTSTRQDTVSRNGVRSTRPNGPTSKL